MCILHIVAFVVVVCPLPPLPPPPPPPPPPICLNWHQTPMSTLSEYGLQKAPKEKYKDITCNNNNNSNNNVADLSLSLSLYLSISLSLSLSLCLLVGCLTSQQHASVSLGRICTDNFTCCHTETEAADQTFHLTQSQYTDTGPTSPSTDPITPGAWQGCHWSANV